MVAELIADYLGGSTRAELAQRYKIGGTSVHNLLRAHKVALRQLSPPDEDVFRRAAALYEAGSSLAEISGQLDLDEETLRRHLHKLHLEDLVSSVRYSVVGAASRGPN